MMGDPVTRGAKRGGDFLPGHLASKFVASLGGGTVAARSGDVKPFVRFDPIDVAAPA